jgi:putative transcriptional regulator
MTAKKSRYGAQLIEALTEAVAIERGEKTAARVTRRALTARQATVAAAPKATSRQILRLRERFALSQPVFAQALNVSADTVRAWEQGKRSPDGAALRLLEVAERNPEVIEQLVQPTKATRTRKLPRR